MTAPSSLPAAPHPSGRLDFHPYVEIFPPMGKKPLLDLAEDIAANGLFDPIVLITDTDDDGEPRTRILDGRHRYLACHETRQPDTYLRFVDFNDVAGPDADPLRWVRSKNLKRRQLTRPQRLDAAARWTEIFEDRARISRQAAAAQTNAQRWGTDTDPANTDTDAQQSLPGTTPPSGRTRDIAAKDFKVSATAVQTTRRIRRDGAEGLADLHRDEKVTMTTAAEIARLPKAAQLYIVEIVKKADKPSEARKLARQLLDEHRSRITTLPQPDAEPAPTAAETPPTAVSTSPTATPTADVAKFYALPDRGEVPISRNAIDVLLAVAGGEHDHPHRDQAIAAVRLQLQHDEWAA